MEIHPGKEMLMKYDLVRRCKTSLERQVGETVRIKLLYKKGVKVLNAKTEYNRCLHPSLAVTGQGGNIIVQERRKPGRCHHQRTQEESSKTMLLYRAWCLKEEG